MKESAGTLLYRYDKNGQLEVLLVHPSGNYNRKSPWGIPKGLPDEGEALEAAARRETMEETSIVAGSLTPLGSINYTKSRKRVHAFAGACPDCSARCASWEVDRAEFVPIAQARALMHPEQRPFLDRLEELLGSQPAGGEHPGGDASGA
jgi:predicted NUDIX family NTP pyrophosphohydrolase